MEFNPESALDSETVRAILMERLRNTRRKMVRELRKDIFWTLMPAALAALSLWWLLNDGGAAWWLPLIINAVVGGSSAWLWGTCLSTLDDIDALMKEMSDED